MVAQRRWQTDRGRNEPAVFNVQFKFEGQSVKRLDLCVFDLSLPEARAQLSKELGEPAAQDVVREALEAGLTEVGASPPGCGMRFAWHVGPQLERKLRASVSDYERRHTRG